MCYWTRNKNLVSAVKNGRAEINAGELSETD